MNKTPLKMLHVVSLLLGACSQGTKDPEQKVDLGSIASLARQTLPPGSEILATCGPSKGHAYFLAPTHDGWTDDVISDGRFIFWVDKRDQPGILFQDAGGKFIDARADGAEIFFSFRNDAELTFGMVEHYPSTGVAETYVISKTAEGNRKALWSSVKANVGMMGVTKAGAYASDCI